LKSIEGDSMVEIEKWIARCENANIAPDDPDLEYGRRKLEVLILRKGIVLCSLSVHVEINTVTSLLFLFFFLLYTLVDLNKYTRRQQT
jgi:hypothetical protein